MEIGDYNWEVSEVDMYGKESRCCNAYKTGAGTKFKDPRSKSWGRQAVLQFAVSSRKI